MNQSFIYKKGGVVLIPFPFTNLSGQKVRPAVVISESAEGDDVIVIFISSKISEKIRKFDIIIKPDKDNGLKTTSLIKCSKIATLDIKVILRKIGFLDKQYQNQVDAKLKNILSLQ